MQAAAVTWEASNQICNNIPARSCNQQTVSQMQDFRDREVLSLGLSEGNRLFVGVGVRCMTGVVFSTSEEEDGHRRPHAV